ncbi:hypothetical protein PMZ80_004421 [Knufia obscura]|uniref:DSBA-like thioredoxin domain-containing protein n=2 Tax=Knufia TaxID=430999 RepID=A0AAN8EIM5_9EURO|nr:hypothetical protein PMZ80_004421 [Knufia obscura]KAK5951702.1 hypothetical protein OHC33_007381 [Knufia fluminis]
MSGGASYLDDAVAKIQDDDAGSGRTQGQGQAKITFYIDIVSPFGYLAWWMLRNSPTFKNVQITPLPILLGGLHKQCGNLAPILIKNKKEWINRERERWAETFAIPIRDGAPPGFPVSTVGAMRVLTALGMEDNLERGVYERVVDVFWAALWCPQSPVLKNAKGRGEGGEFDVKSPEVLTALLGSVDGIDEDRAREIVKRTGEKDVKDRLVGNTNLAFERGAFGMPWFECENSKGEKEGFWGFDHLGQVVRFLGLDERGDLGRSGRGLRALL